MKTYVTCCRLRRTFANNAMLLTVSLAVLSLAMLGGQAVYAQQVIADGTTQTASGTINTGTSGPPLGYALRALNNGIITSSSPLTLITGGSSAHGAVASSGGQITIASGSTVTTTGADGYGLFATGTGGTASMIAATNTAISTTATRTYGIYAVQGGVINLTGGSVTTTGDSAFGALASNDGQMILNNASITTTGDSAVGTFAGNAGRLTITGGSVTTSGISAIGLWATQGSLLTADGINITTQGDYSDGASAQLGSELRLNGGTITLTGTGSAGLYAVGLLGTTGASLTANRVTVTTSGANSYGAVVFGGSSLIIADGSSITTTGPGSVALFSSAYDPNPSTATITNSTLTSVQDAGILTDSTTLNASFTGSSLTGGAALMQTINDGTLNLMADSSTLSGAALTETSSGSISNVTLLNNTLWTMTGNSNVTSLTNNASTISFTTPTGDPTLLSSYKTLTTGSYVGQGGTIAFNTALGGDGSPTDQLHVTETTVGDTFVRVSNASGSGAETVEGIRLVEVDGTSDGQFRLLGDYVTKDSKQAVVSGAYTYTLEKNGISTPSDGDWYLRSQLTADPPEEPGEPEIFIPKGPRYAPGVPIYEAYPQVLQALNGLPSLQKRVGNRFWKSPQDIAGDGTDAWGRIEGVHTRFTPTSSTSSTNSDIDTFKLQVGIDGLLYDDETGTLISGFTLHYGHGTANMRSFFGNGRINTDGYGVGGTLTWYGSDGFYVDGQAQATWYRSNLLSRAQNIVTPQLAESNDGFGYAASVEAGKSMDLANNWSITPQAQLIYSAVNFDSFTDPFSAQISLDHGDSLQSRFGLALDYDRTWQADNGQINHNHVYGIANLFYEFLDGTTVDVSDTDFVSRNDRLWGGIGLGASYSWDNDKYVLYGEDSVNTSLAYPTDNYAVMGTIGLRMEW